MRTKLESQIDNEFECMGIKPHVYHFNDHARSITGIDNRPAPNPHRIWAYGGVTVVTQNPDRSAVEGAVLKEQAALGIFHTASKDTLAGLRGRGPYYGVAICDLRDQFSRKRGRIIAKGRLLTYLKEAKSDE